MLQANNLLRESDSSTPFEDYSIFLYRQSAPQFNDRVKELEQKLLYPVRECKTRIRKCVAMRNVLLFSLIKILTFFADKRSKLLCSELQLLLRLHIFFNRIHTKFIIVRFLHNSFWVFEETFQWFFFG